MLEHKQSVQHTEDGRRVEHAHMSSGYETNLPPSYIISVDHND